MSNVTHRPVKTLITLLIAAVGVFGISTATFAATKATQTTATALAQPGCGDTSSYDVVKLGDLPPEASDTENLISSGGPFPYPQDGTVFDNREGILPACAANYYHEYTVKTPGSPDRGARRIVTGSGGEHFYTGDHYATFQLIDLNGAPSQCGNPTGIDKVGLSSLPTQVADAVARIKAGGPFPFPNDGTVYQNREHVLPTCAADYYHLYGVADSSGADSGDGRVITGGAGEFFYTSDHYATFAQVDVNA